MGTPIGNPDDISARAADVLREVDLIACEDTRRSARILAAHSIRTPTVSYFEHNEERRVPELIERLKNGAKVALITDAGTPCISDPGYRLVKAAHEANLRVASVPGPSAVVAALSIAGIPTDRFVFEGFLPSRPAARREALARLADEERTIVVFEAARRLRDALADMAVVFGSERTAAVVREISKNFEETIRGAIGEIQRTFDDREPLGEVTIVIEGARGNGRETAEVAKIDVNHTVDLLREAGLSLKQASAVVAEITGVRKRDIYRGAIAPGKRDD